MGILDTNSTFLKIGLKPATWDAVTNKDLLTTHFDYYSSLTFSQFIENLNLPSTIPSPTDYPDDLEILELDEELIKALDHHSLITSQLPVDHIQTADEIIEEIDRLMIGENSDLDLELYDPQTTADFRSNYAWKPLSVLEQMSVAQLNALVDELDVCIRHYSACLVQELAVREELEYEQEVKDVFFTRLHEVQNRMDEWATRNAAEVRVSAHGSKAYVDEDDDDDANLVEERKRGVFGGASSAVVAKAILANAAFAVRRRWRRMGRSLDKARSTWHRGRRRRHPANENFNSEDRFRARFRGCTQPIASRDVTMASARSGGGKMCVSNSTLELASDGETRNADDEEEAEEWSVRSETNSTATTPTTDASVAANGTSSSAIRLIVIKFGSPPPLLPSGGKRNPDEDLKFLSTKIPYHQSSSYSGACNGPSVGHLELFNEFLLCMLTNNPNLTPLLTDYILNGRAMAKVRLAAQLSTLSPLCS